VRWESFAMVERSGSGSEGGSESRRWDLGFRVRIRVQDRDEARVAEDQYMSSDVLYMVGLVLYIAFLCV